VQVREPEEEGTRREVPLLPRWPLGARDARATGDVKSSKKKRMAPPLTGIGGIGGGGGSAAADLAVVPREGVA
jgi:hypothetical protein